MSVTYKAIEWNRQKIRYDRALWMGIVIYLALFIGAGGAAYPDATAETLLIRGLGSAALLLLHVILSIGPLARLDARFLPLLYNRRHLGVSMFFLALAHGTLSVFQFHSLGDVNPLVSVFISNPRVDSISQFPFQPLGAVALLILFLMAATSHDFWLRQLTPPVWKALHMSVYVAYALVILHVTLGTLQAETNPALAGLLGMGVLGVSTLHFVAGQRERVGDGQAGAPAADDGFVDVCGVDDIQEKRAKIVSLGGERVAVFRYDGQISAVSNVCRHQNGPLGEGRIIDGCITCPWHGYQYRPDDGASPPPFTEKVPTFLVQIRSRRVWVHPTPKPAGTRVPPAPLEPTEAS